MTKNLNLSEKQSIVTSTFTLPANEKAALVSVQNHQVVTTSLQIAEFFRRPHKDVLSSIRGLECSIDFRERNFSPSCYIRKNGNITSTYPMYYVAKDGFVFLAMGFTGKVAAQFKEAYINAFNEMEAMLRNNQATEYAKKLLKVKVETFNKRMQAGIEYGRKQHGKNYGGAGSMVPTLPFSDSMDLDSNLNNIFAFVGNSYGDSMYFISELFKKEEELKELKKRISQFTYDMGSKFGLY